MPSPLASLRIVHLPAESVPPDAPPPAGFDVLDPSGVPIGVVAGWIDDIQDTPVFLVITLYRWNGDVQVCLPLGAIISVNPRQQRLRLHEANRESILNRCVVLEETVPAESALQNTRTFFPNPRPSVAELLGSMCRKALQDAGTANHRWVNEHSYDHAQPTWRDLASWGSSG